MTYETPIGANMFAYCMNNPTISHDTTGLFVETLPDVLSACYSLHQAINDPSMVNAALFVWDAVAVIAPVVPGSYIKRGADSTFKIISKLNDGQDVINTVIRTNGSTAKQFVSNHLEYYALQEVISNPCGEVLENVVMQDTRWLSKDGWVKMKQYVNTSRGNIEIHYVFNKISNMYDDFKIKRGVK